MSLQDLRELAQTVELAIENAERALAEGRGKQREIVIQSLEVVGLVVADLLSVAKAVGGMQEMQVSSRDQGKREYIETVRKAVREVRSPVVEEVKIKMRHPIAEGIDNVICSYVGETENGLPHGLGKIDCKSSVAPFTCFGTFKLGVLQDKAFLFDHEETLHIFDTRNGVRQGRGVIFRDGVMAYNGAFHEKQKHGYGQTELVNGDVFEGQWYRDLMKEGLKTYRYPKYGKEGYIFSTCRVEYDPETDLKNGVKRWQQQVLLRQDLYE